MAGSGYGVFVRQVAHCLWASYGCETTPGADASLSQLRLHWRHHAYVQLSHTTAMYVDSKPTSTFRDTLGWTMPSPFPTGTIRRPSIIRSDSSSPSLSGMEQYVPSFQQFVKRTPSVPREPLPAPPYEPRRASGSSAGCSRTPPVYAARRTSSVYSRSVSQWGSDNSSWKSDDFVDEPLPPLPTLQAVAYSASTPQLGEKQQPTPLLLQARNYSPLMITPSPTASRVSTPSPPPQRKPSILLPEPPVSVQVPRKHLRTVSLEQAKAEINAPGAVHLLPEELRAQTAKKSKSHDPLRMDSVALIAGASPLKLPDPPTLVDNQGRQRTLNSVSEPPASEYPFPPMDPESQDTGLAPRIDKSNHAALPLHLQQRKTSKDKATQTLGIDDVNHEQRGRTRYRKPRNVDYEHHIPNKRIETGRSSSEEETDARKIGKEYHSLLTDQYRSPTSSPTYHRAESDGSVNSHMKMIPKPLFQTKPPAQLPGAVNFRWNESYMSPYRLSDGNESFQNRRKDSSGSSLGPNPFENRRRFPSNSSVGPNPFELSHMPESTSQRRSTNGSIPISPPSDISPLTISEPPERLPVKQHKATNKRRGSDDYRASAFYPHVAPRKGRKSRTQPSKTDRKTPPMRLLHADIVAERLKTPDDSPVSTPHYKTPPSSQGSRDKYRKHSNASADSERPRLHERITKTAAKYTDLLTKPSELPERRNQQPALATRVIPGSPHLVTSPNRSKPAPVHLGWSDSAKTSYDKSRSLIASPKWYQNEPESPRTSNFTHIVTPARPLDERAAGLNEEETPRRKGSIFGSMFDGWKEIKAEKRREELKKVIKVFPNTPTITRRASTFGWM